MAQGHAISLMCRMYSVAGDEKYLIAATKSLNIFNMNVNAGGVRAYLFNNLNNTWYEEYPTEPTGLFVLNGFIYSLIGLYDFVFGGCSNSNSSLSSIINHSNHKLAYQLYSNGLRSLTRNINLFDTGIRSLYDLKHLQGDTNVNPNVARWDYHSVHVSQLFYLVEMIRKSINITSTNPMLRDLLDRSETELQAKMLFNVANRWLNYTKGTQWNQNSQIN